MVYITVNRFHRGFLDSSFIYFYGLKSVGKMHPFNNLQIKTRKGRHSWSCLPFFMLLFNCFYYNCGSSSFHLSVSISLLANSSRLP